MLRAATAASSALGTNGRRGVVTGRSSATGAPLRVTTKLSPAATAAMIAAFWFRSSRCGMTVDTAQA